MKRKIIPVILIVLTIGLAVLSYITLPETVITQFSIGTSENNTTMPKFFALLIPSALGIGGAVSAFFSKDDEKANRKGLLISVVGIAVFIVMMIVN